MNVPADAELDGTEDHVAVVVEAPTDPMPTGPTAASIHKLRLRNPELDWSDPEGALETLSILNDAEAMADLDEAETDIAEGSLIPLHRYAAPI